VEGKKKKKFPPYSSLLRKKKKEGEGRIPTWRDTFPFTDVRLRYENMVGEGEGKGEKRPKKEKGKREKKEGRVFRAVCIAFVPGRCAEGGGGKKKKWKKGGGKGEENLSYFYDPGEPLIAL